MPTPTLRPTFHCFDDALDFLELLRLGDPTLRDDILASIRVAHAVCVSSTGFRYAHAWVEERVRDDPDRADWPSRAVWQGYLDDAGRRGWYAVDAEWFYRTFAVRRCVLYTLTECAWHNRASGHYGPWRSDLYALATRQGSRAGRVVGNVEGASPLGIIEPTTLDTANAKRRSVR